MVTRISGVLRTSDSTGSVASNGSGPEPAASSSQPSSPQHPTQEGAILTTMIAARHLSSKFVSKRLRGVL
ncbi:hypothetical protein OSTOST_00686 [Ostertagia ostertagi]